MFSQSPFAVHLDMRRELPQVRSKDSMKSGGVPIKLRGWSDEGDRRTAANSTIHAGKGRL